MSVELISSVSITGKADTESPADVWVTTIDCEYGRVCCSRSEKVIPENQYEVQTAGMYWLNNVQLQILQRWVETPPIQSTQSDS